MAFGKKRTNPKLQRLSPMGRLGFGQNRLKNVLGVNRNPKSADSFVSSYKSRATNLY